MIQRCRSLPLRTNVRVASMLFSLALSLAPNPASAVTITIKNADLPGKGFNDASARAPVGGNPGQTLGAQRLNLFQHAADLWSKRLGGNVPIIVTASFSAQGGTSFSAVLGFARPTTVHSDFTGAPTPKSWYVAALANQLRGFDLNDAVSGSCPIALVNTHCPEIEAIFNSDVDNQAVLGAVDFYYGFDGNAGSDLDFLSVILHEIGHGLGIISLVDGSTGARFNGLTDAFTDQLEDAAMVGKKLSQMTDSQRRLAIRDDNNLVFIGDASHEAAAALDTDLVSDVDAKRDDGALKVFAPSTYIAGSSVSHVDTKAAPNELMEPFLNNPAARNLDLTVAMLEDLGWTTPVLQKCGDVNNDLKITTGDALSVLRGAVGLSTCPAAVCNVNGLGGVTTGDALLVLKVAVGQNVVLTCPLS